MSKYVSHQEVKRLFGFHPKTLNRWVLANRIDFILLNN
jgi:hypothetical protein